MGMYSDAYEQYRINSERIDWSDDKTIASIVRIWLLSALAIIFGHPYIPWRLVLIAVGLAVFTANTGAGLAVRSHLTSVHWSEMLNRCRAPVDRLWKAWRIKSASQLLAQQHKLQNYADNEQLQYHSDELDNLLVVECFENQRYWAGMGWIPHMLSSERPPWSDGKGTRSMRPKEEYQEPGELINSGMAFESNLTADCVPVESQSLPAGVEWHWHPESIWAVDTEWAKGLSATSDSLLIDRDGWLYSDHKWQFQKKTSKRCLTRQRRWIRVAQGCPAASAG
jgi:hypothetical protein